MNSGAYDKILFTQSKIQNPKSKLPGSFLTVLLTCFLLVSGCKSDQPDPKLQEQVNKLQTENASLKSEIELLKVQLSNPTLKTTPSSTANTTQPPATVAFEDIKGVAAEKEITQLGQLGVFDTTTGKFTPQKPITRAEFVRWLVRANNAMFAGTPDKILRLPETGKATFSDVPPTHPDFRYIQGMTDAGYVIGYDEKTFKPTQTLTREEMLAIKAALDHRGPFNSYTGGSPGSWTDSDTISKKYWAALHFESVLQNKANIGRTFGTIKTLKPQAPVTRAEAAVYISAISDSVGFTTAEAALQKRAGQPLP
jgi:uncharacterized protein YcfL